MEPNNIHIGTLINELLEKQHKTKRELGDDIGMSQSQAVYLGTRKSIDALMLQKIGNALKYNFFKHYPIEEEGTGDGGQGTSEKDASTTLRMTTLEEEKKKLLEKNTELEKQLEGCRRDLLFQKQENGYLKKINELLEKRK